MLFPETVVRRGHIIRSKLALVIVRLGRWDKRLLNNRCGSHSKGRDTNAAIEASAREERKMNYEKQSRWAYPSGNGMETAAAKSGSYSHEVKSRPQSVLDKLPMGLN